MHYSTFAKENFRKKGTIILKMFTAEKRLFLKASS